MSTVSLSSLTKLLALSIALISAVGLNTNAQDTIITAPTVDTVSQRVRWIFFRKADVRVSWQVEAEGDSLPAATFATYRVECAKDSGFSKLEAYANVGPVDTATLVGLAWGQVYYIRVVGTDSSHMSSKISKTLDTCFGNTLASESTDKKYSSYYDILLATPSTSTLLGKLAFAFIGMSLLIGLSMWWFKTFRVLRAHKIFPIGHSTTWGVSQTTMDNLINRLHGSKCTCNTCNWLKQPQNKNTLRGKIGTLTTMRGSHFSRVFNLLGLYPRSQTHSNNRTCDVVLSGFRAIAKRQDVGQELERAATAEIEDLRRLSYVDILWALGVTAPLLGLFGTITGVSYAFFERWKSGGAMDELARGIFEALGTTIAGLIVGVLLMLVYYYYNYKLDRIGAIWMMMCKGLSDELPGGPPGSSSSKPPGPTQAPTDGSAGSPPALPTSKAPNDRKSSGQPEQGP